MDARELTRDEKKKIRSLVTVSYTHLVPAGKEETMQEKVADATPAAPLKLDVSVRVIEPVKNLMGFASVKFNDCFVVENLKIVQGRDVYKRRLLSGVSCVLRSFILRQQKKTA